MSSLDYTNLTSIEETYNQQNGIVSFSNPKDLNKNFITFNQNINSRTTNSGEMMNGGMMNGGMMNGEMMNGGMMNGGMMNGMNGSAFHLESGNKPFKSSNTYYSSLMENSQRKTLADIFFSNSNKNMIISKLNEKKCNIDKIMNGVFDEHQNSNIYNTMNQDNVLNTLNDKVIEKCIKSSYINETSHTKYIKDVTTLAPPMSHPKSTNKSSTLEFKRFF